MKLIKTIAYGLTALGALHGNAATDQDSMNFTASVFQTCHIDSTADTSFGFIDGLFSNNIDAANGSVSVLCSDGSSYSIGLGNGNNFSSPNRQMSNGAQSPSFIAYTTFTDPARTIPWGDIGFGPLNGVGNGIVQNYTVYARIPSGQNPAPVGNYSDQLTVTLSF